MADLRRGWERLPLRLRLTIWFLGILTLTIPLFGLLLHVELERRMIAATDAALEVSAAQLTGALDEQGGEPRFEGADFRADGVSLDDAAFVARLLSPDGSEVWDEVGAGGDLPPDPEPVAGYTSRSGAESDWRVLTRPLVRAGRTAGWLVVAQSIEGIEEALEALQNALLVGLPLLLLVTGSGGYWLARRALSPIDDVISTARQISASDLQRRLAYRGAADEVGRLAQTFDEMLDRLEAAWTQERRFTADAAHELRTPLAILKGQIEVARSRPRSISEYEHTLDELAPQVERLIRLTTDLLFLARFDQVRPLPEREEVDLTELLASIADQLRPLMTSGGLHFSTEIDPRLRTHAEPDLLIRLLLNLLDNARRYTPAGGTVTLTAGVRDREIEIAVEDSGPGIPAEALPHLFERFYRVDHDRSRASGGGGLGLAIAQEIARAHGGRIEVESAPGRGSRFAVYLPSPDG